MWPFNNKKKEGFLVSDLTVKWGQSAVGLEHDLSKLVAVANLQSFIGFVKICQPASSKRNSQCVVHRCSAGSRICLGIISATETSTALYSLTSALLQRQFCCAFAGKLVDGPTVLTCFANQVASNLPKFQRGEGCRTQAWQNGDQGGVSLRLVKF